MRVIFTTHTVHAGSEKGFVPNCLLLFSGKNKIEDYHSEMNANKFTKRITEKLIPNLHEPSILLFLTMLLTIQ